MVKLNINKTEWGVNMKTKTKVMLVNLVTMYLHKKVMRSSAALSYYLMLTFFPFLICFSWIISLFNINFDKVAKLVNGIIPASAIEIMEGYMVYVQSNQSKTLLIVGGIMFMTGLSAAFRLIVVGLEDINGTKRIKGLKFYMWGIASSSIFIFGTYLLLMISMISGVIINFLQRHIYLDPHLFETLPYTLLLGYMFLVLIFLYKKSHPKGYPIKWVWKGALAAAIGIILVSIIFSKFIGLSTRYSLVYGSLSSVILLMVWLFACSNVIFCGNILNHGLSKIREIREIGGK